VSAPRTLRLAHRGDWRRFPENSLAALLAALEIPGCDGIEFDVRLSRDGVPVLSHDETLTRVLGVRRRVNALTGSQLEELGVPMLEATLAAVPRRAFLDVELKGVHGRATVDVLTGGRGPGLARAVVSSFEPASLAVVGRLAPAWPRWLNADDLEPSTLARASELGCTGVSVQWRAIDRRGIARARAAELDVAAWTVRRRPTYRRLARLGVVAICAEGNPLDHGEEPP
jgi:glycerophosphoryl diester phosphodiesterase